MVEAHLVEDGGVEIVDVDGVFDDIIAKLIGFAVHARLDAPARHPDREGAGVMVAPVIVESELALTIVGSAKFAAPDNERFVQQAPLLQVGYQGRRRLIYVFGLTQNFAGQIAVGVPALVVKLHEAYAFFGKFSGQ